MNSMLRKVLFRNIAFISVLAVTACDSQQRPTLESDQLTLPVPSVIRQVATLNALPLEVQVSVNDEFVRKRQVEDVEQGVSIVVDVPEGRDNKIDVGWYANIGSQTVLLADFTTTVVRGDTVLNVGSYNVGLGAPDPRYDADGDGRTNLEEAKENRNLLSEFDLEVPMQSTFGGVFAEVRDTGNDPDVSGDIVEQDGVTTFSLRHDGSNLIVYVCGKDQTLHGDYVSSPDAYWDDDVIFIFIDGADSNNPEYDNFDDFQIAFLRKTGETIISKGANNPFCTNGSCLAPQSPFYTPINASCTYEFSVSLPLADFHMEVGRPIGFDIELTDDDNGGVREGSSAWIGFKDKSNLDPRTFGTIILK